MLHDAIVTVSEERSVPPGAFIVLLCQRSELRHPGACRSVLCLEGRSVVPEAAVDMIDYIIVT